MPKLQLMSVIDTTFKDSLVPNMNHQNAEVRKNVIFCLVELRVICGNDDFKPYYDRIPVS